jgi:Helicase associated domain
LAHTLGFVWATERSKKQDEDWNARLEQLREYKDAHGDCLVPHGYKVDPSFAEWVHRQRTTYAIHLKEGRVNPMVEGRMKKLEDMGFNFVRYGCFVVRREHDMIDLLSEPHTHRIVLAAVLEGARRQVDGALRTAPGVSEAERKLPGPDPLFHKHEAGPVGAHAEAPAPAHAEGKKVVDDGRARQAAGGARV